MFLQKLLKLLLAFLVYIPIAIYFLMKPSNYEKSIIINRPGINSLKILRDEYAVPHINSETLKDIFYGVGYAQAQDRLWEMHFKRITYAGRLSEFLGNSTLEIDKMMKNFGFFNISQTNYENMPLEEVELLQAFADGVNDYAFSLKYLPFEFLLSGINFEPWRPVDSILVLKLLEFSVAFKWTQQLMNYYLQEFYDKEFIKEITGMSEENHYDKTQILSDEELLKSGLFYKHPTLNTTKKKSEDNKEKPKVKNEYIAAGLENMINFLQEIERGSNSWVIHGNHTTTGKPLLANDPHLRNSIPSVWYPVHFHYGANNENHVFGVSTSGAPFILIGQTNYVSWGMTSFLADDSDLFLEKLNEEKTHYEFDGKYYPLETFKEEIKIKGQASHFETIMKTKHGIILNKPYDLASNNQVFPEKREHFSFSWTGYLKQNSLTTSCLQMYKSKNVYELHESINIMQDVYQNLVFADVEGNIGYCASGLFKIKNRINNNEFFPLDGSKSENDWIGYIPKKENIFVINPPKGYIITANNKPCSDNIKYEYVNSGKPTARALRINKIIEQLISEKRKISVEDIKKIQLDTIDEYAKIILPNLIEIVQSNLNLVTNDIYKEKINHFIEMLKKWDCDMNGESKEALIYNMWYYFSIKRFLSEVEPKILQKRIVSWFGFEQFLLRKLRDWKNKGYFQCSNQRNSNKNRCILIFIDALIESFEFLEKKFGKESTQWKWKNLNVAIYSHHLFSQTPLKNIYERQVPRSGNLNTIDPSGREISTQDSFNSVTSANFRFISSLNRNEKSYFVFDTGMNECPLSPHYTDFLYLHRKGKYHEIQDKYLEEEAFYITSLKNKKLEKS